MPSPRIILSVSLTHDVILKNSCDTATRPILAAAGIVGDSQRYYGGKMLFCTIFAPVDLYV